MTDHEITNGDWYAYKRAVLQQLETLLADVVEIRETIRRIDHSVTVLTPVSSQIADLRSALRIIDQNMGTLVPVSRCELTNESLRAKIETLSAWKASSEGKASKSIKIAIVAIIVSGLIGLVTMIHAIIPHGN